MGPKSPAVASEGRGWVLCEQGPLEADRCGLVGTVNQSQSLSCCGFLWKRYCYYLTNGIQKDMIAPEEDEVMRRISKLTSNTLLTRPLLEPLMTILMKEKENDYYTSLMKSIGKAGCKWGKGLLCGGHRLSLTIHTPWFLRKCQKHPFPSNALPHVTHFDTSTSCPLMCIHITWRSFQKCRF